MRLFRLAAMFLFFAQQTGQATAGDDLFSLSLEDLAQIKVRIATGTPKALVQAPAAATIITAQDIAASGAQDIDTVLEGVPGLHVSRGSFLYAPRYFIRGIVSTYNPHTLLLVNGVPQTGLFVGDRGERISSRFSLPVEAVDRIEIIRGPGSALYGADAFAGVINIITREPGGKSRNTAKVRVGSFDTASGYLQQGASLGSINSVFSLAYYQTGGDHNATLTSDAQSNVDLLGFAPPASLTPGPVATSTRDYDIRLVLGWDRFRLHASWMRAWDIGTGHGINEALDPEARFTVQRGNLDLNWHDPAFTSHWGLDSQISYLYSTYQNNNGIFLFPPNAFFGAFPQGVISHPGLKEENARFGVNALYQGWQNHQLRLGAGFYWGDIYKVTDTRNWMFSAGPVPIVPRAQGFEALEDTVEIYQPEHQRRNHYVYMQDEWTLAQHWELTAGLRHDRFDDVGSTTNPRLALVWATTPTLTSKLLYGEAFRPPAFFELYGASNPVALGNPDLEPEKLKNIELAFNWRPASNWALDANFYHFRIRDYIDFVNNPGTSTFTARNASRIRGQGLELEARHQLDSGMQILLNYSRQNTEDESTGHALDFAPDAEAYLRVVWDVAPRWQCNPQLNWVGKRQRPADDPRQSLEGYTAFDLALRKHWPDKAELALVGQNLFDADVREPSRGPEDGQALPNIAHDLPQAGRSISLSFSKYW